MLLDTHFHYDFLAPQLRPAFDQTLRAQGVQVVGQTLLPSTYRELRQVTPPAGPLLSLGFHPWWMTSPAQVEAELEIFEAEVDTTRLIGEIGLDFLPRRLETSPAEVQLGALRRIVSAVLQAADGQPEQKPYVLSLHAVRATTTMLDLFKELSLPGSPMVPVIHRFGGTSDELTRLVRLGGCISVHPQMLESKRGRAYIRQVPADRLLLETDLPEQPTDTLDVQLFAQEVGGRLRRLVERISAERGVDFLPILLENQRRLYSL
ncbi:MAG: TatD family hydrolase [Rothia sp. (in: high G+C Gram-positive bacteria)]|uniref:TatD family hydrolase n=1 Tax=Rothia sp. (in: high G+C Gram-positive bacteria) TaxID=1885016 RepID=UPI0027052EB8|nr:TatD family hydrolase [Rothia sp. (in: high G+C Gram-positive bacteria)]